MIFALDTSQNFLDVVEAPDQTGSQVEAFGAEGPPLLFPELSSVKTRTEEVVDDCLERVPALFHFLLESDGHVVVEGQCRPHISMICT